MVVCSKTCSIKPLGSELNAGQMKIAELFPTKWLKAADFNGQAWMLTIESITIRLIERDKKKPVIMFQGQKKGLVLNKTNGNTIASFLGEDTDDWIGKKIVLYPTQADFQGRVVACIRVRAPKKQSNTAAAAPPRGIMAESVPDVLDEDIVP